MANEKYRLCKDGHRNPLVAKYCKYCGEPLEQNGPLVDDKVCSECGLPHKYAGWLEEKILWLEREIGRINENLESLVEKSKTKPKDSEKTASKVEESDPKPESKPVNLENLVIACVGRYNEAVEDDLKRQKFDKTYVPTKVAISNSEEIRKGESMNLNFMPELGIYAKGDFFIIALDGKFFLFPEFELDDSHYYNIKACFDLEKDEEAFSKKAIIKELKKPALCEILKTDNRRFLSKGADNLRLVSKGVAIIKTWPTPRVPKTRKRK